MYQKPSPIIQILIRNIVEIREQIEDIQKKIQDPDLFEKLQKTSKKDQ